MACNRRLPTTPRPVQGPDWQLLIITLVTILTLGACSLGSGPVRERGQLDCQPIRDARSNDRGMGVLLGAGAIGLMVATVASQSGRENSKGSNDEAAVYFPMAVLVAVPAVLFGLSAATGTNKLTQCDRRRRKETLPAAVGLPRAPRD